MRVTVCVWEPLDIRVRIEYTGATGPANVTVNVVVAGAVDAGHRSRLSRPHAGTRGCTSALTKTGLTGRTPPPAAPVSQAFHGRPAALKIFVFPSTVFFGLSRRRRSNFYFVLLFTCAHTHTHTMYNTRTHLCNVRWYKWTVCVCVCVQCTFRWLSGGDHEIFYCSVFVIILSCIILNTSTYLHNTKKKKIIKHTYSYTRIKVVWTGER